MSQFVKMFRGPKVEKKKKKKSCQQGEIENLQQREELLRKRRDYLEMEIEQELQTAKSNSRRNRRVALQALRRKRWYEKQLKNMDCALKALKSAHENINMKQVKDLMKDFDDEDSAGLNPSDGLLSSEGSELHFDEDELLAELERLEKNLDRRLVGTDFQEELLPAPPTDGDSGDEEVEEQLDFLRRWINESP